MSQRHTLIGSQDMLLEAYESLLGHTSRMLESARSADWSRLVDQEADYVVQVERLRRLDDDQALDRAGRTHKAMLLERILEQDLEIRQHLVERREELGRLIGVSLRQRDLYRAYGPQDGGSAVAEAGARFTQRPS